jgi:hypothetical protein
MAAGWRDGSDNKTALVSQVLLVHRLRLALAEAEAGLRAFAEERRRRAFAALSEPGWEDDPAKLARDLWKVAQPVRGPNEALEQFSTRVRVWREGEP